MLDPTELHEKNEERERAGRKERKTYNTHIIVPMVFTTPIQLKRVRVAQSIPYKYPELDIVKLS